MGKYGKKNEVNLDPLKYNLALIGESGIGKTTIIKEYCEKLAGEEGYIFLETGKEDGADAIEGIVFENCEDWDKFEGVIDDILENKTRDYPELRVVAIDTYDELCKIAEPEVIRMHNNDNPDKPVKTIKAAFGGFQSGEDKVIEIVLDKLWSLKKVGVSFILIGHTKSKSVDDPITGQSFVQLTTNMSLRYFNAIKTKVHFLGVAAIDRRVVQEKTGKKDFITKKEITKGVIKDETRKITFRDNNFVIDSKSRFSDVIDEIPMNYEALIQAVKDAILKEHSKGNKSLAETQKKQESVAKEKQNKVAEDEVMQRKNKELSAYVDVITDFIKNNKSKMDVLKPFLASSKKLGFANPTLVDNIEEAKKLIALIQ